MIEAYIASNINFEQNGNAALDPSSCDLDMTLNGSWELTLEAPLDELEKYKFIEAGGVIAAPTPKSDKQFFRIYEMERTEKKVTAYARPIFLDAANEVMLVDCRPTNLTGQKALDYMMNGTKYSGVTDITLTNTAYYVRKNLIEALAGDADNVFLSRWGGEISYDNYTINIAVKQGENKGSRLEFGYNIESIKEDVDFSDTMTRIVPVAYNGYMLEGSEPWVDSDKIDSYPVIYTRVVEFDNIRYIDDKPDDTSDDDEDIVYYNTLKELRAALIEQCEKLYEEGADLPSTTYTINVIDLSNTLEYEDYKSVETMNLGDTVRCYHRGYGIETEARVIRIVYDCIRKRNTSVTLGDYQDDYFSRMDTTAASMATQADFEQLATQITYIKSNYIQTSQIDTITANIETAIITEVSAKFATIEYVEANYATIEYANITYATIDDLSAAKAYITELTADLANINSILAGNIGTGAVQTIHLTAANSVIDEEVVMNLIAANANIASLLAGEIYTNQINIYGDESKLLSIVNNTIQISDGAVVRVQIGEDGNGDYNLYLWDADGNILWNATGVTEEGLNDGIIKDVAVADDAAISGYKLDIDSVTSYLNATGGLVVDAAQVTINNTTLAAVYTTITSSLGDLQNTVSELGAEVSIASMVPYYALTTADDTELLDENGEELLDENGEVLYDFTIVTDWTTTPLTASDGQYLWMRYLITYTDGTQEWTEPICITDSVIREKVTTLVTDFSVVQGQISAKIWLDDIETAVDAVEGEITTITTDLSDLSITVGEISSTVSEVQTTQDETSIAIESLQTQIEQTAEDVNIVINQNTQSITETAESVDNLIETLYKYFTFSADGLTIGDGSSEITLVLNNGIIEFQNSGATFAYWSGDDNEFHTGDLIVDVNNKAQFGDFAFIPREDGSLSFLKIT